MVIWCEIQVLEGVMEFFGVSWKGSWNVRENGFRKSVDTLSFENGNSHIPRDHTKFRSLKSISRVLVNKF